MGFEMKKQIEIINQQFKELSSIYHSAASQSGISDNEFWIWYALLVLKGEYSQQDICELWCLPKQTVNTIVSNLIKKGYISLEVVPGTRNRKIIRISEEGRKYGEGIVMPVFQKEKNSLKKLSSEEIQLYIDILGKYIHFLKSELEE